MASDQRKSLGRLGEQLAAAHFERLGWQIVARNHHTRIGELDLIAVDGWTLVFAEVKTCRLGRRQPWESLHERKRSQVRRVAGMWLSQACGLPRFEHLRFDAVGVIVDARGALVRLDHIEGAF
jgi:putative endonuclease